MKHRSPKGWPGPRGHSNGVPVDGRHVHVAGMTAWDETGRFAEGFARQFKQILEDTLAVLAEAYAGPEYVVRMTWYDAVLDAHCGGLAEIGAAHRRDGQEFSGYGRSWSDGIGQAGCLDLDRNDSGYPLTTEQGLIPVQLQEYNDGDSDCPD